MAGGSSGSREQQATLTNFWVYVAPVDHYADLAQRQRKRVSLPAQFNVSLLPVKSQNTSIIVAYNVVLNPTQISIGGLLTKLP